MSDKEIKAKLDDIVTRLQKIEGRLNPIKQDVYIPATGEWITENEHELRKLARESKFKAVKETAEFKAIKE